MWVRTQNKNLINLDNVVEVRKTSSLGATPNKGWKVIVIDSSPEGMYVIANGLTEEQADQTMTVLWKAIPAEDSVDVGGWLK